MGGLAVRSVEAGKDVHAKEAGNDCEDAGQQCCAAEDRHGTGCAGSGHGDPPSWVVGLPSRFTAFS
ncbi:hypothetical protein GCM10009825_32880 [Arthrobacter humicola]|uniref:Uncharacterized protein n=1 Tax=Arthrobacter humicola TaxID=409291 RepID=A0ABN2ZJ33_9MICC